MSKTTLILFLCCVAAAQTHKNTAEQLGYPAGTKLLIIHADDLAVSHSVDRASFAALDSKSVTAASIMVPCPWLTEVAAYATANPHADLGLHLTLTSEWKTYRWGPATRQSVPGLLAPDGNLWSDTPLVVKNAKPEEVEAELRAQIERARAVGIHPTHVDAHMAAAFAPPFLPVYIKLAREYGIPFFMVRPADAPASLDGLIKDTDILADNYVMAPGNAKAENWREFYTTAIRSLKPGLTEMIVHLGYDDAELQAVTAGHPDYGSAWRERDFKLVTSPEFKKLLAENKVTLIGWRDIQKHWGH